MDDLSTQHCKPCEGGGAALNPTQVSELLARLDGWTSNDDHTEISRTYSFKNYYHTIAFVNAVAWVAHKQDHHPDLEVAYNKCKVRYSTHAIGGLSENDFICAARVDALFNGA